MTEKFVTVALLSVCLSWVCLAKEIDIPANQGFAEAVKAVAEFRQANPEYDQPVVVTFAAGTRYLDRPILLGREISGNEKSPTIFRANGDVVFSGGEVIRGWDVGTDGVWSVPADIEHFRSAQIAQLRFPHEFVVRTRNKYFDEEVAPNQDESIEGFALGTNDYPFTQLFVNDQRRFRPRYPEGGYFRIAGQYDPADGNPGRGDHRFFWNREDNLRTEFRNRGDVDVLAFLIQSMTRNPLAGISKGDSFSNNVVSITGRTGGGWGRYQKGYPYFFENVYEEFKRPGQWYWDRQTSRLLYRPKAGETPENCRVVVPRLTRLMIARNVRHIKFEGLQFAHAAFWRGPYGGLNPQGELNSYSAIYLWGGQYNEFRNCCFRNTGSYALTITKSASDNLVEGCEFFDIGAGCIKIIGNRNTVRDCDLGYFGRYQPGGTGVMVHIANNTRIEHCDIHDAYYMGVNIGYHFGYHHPSVAHDNIVSHNHIWHLGDNLLADQGGVYVVGVNEGTVVEGNLIHDITARMYGGWGIYTDEGATGVKMIGNVVYNTKHAGFHQHFGHDNLVANNVFVDCGAEQSVIAVTRVDQPKSFFFRDNVMSWSGRQRAFNREWEWKPEFFKSDRNFLYNGAETNVICKGWSKFGFDANSTVGVDPMFVDPDNRDYRLKPESPVYKSIHFKPVLEVKPGRISKPLFAPKFPPVPNAYEEPIEHAKKISGRGDFAFISYQGGIDLDGVGVSFMPVAIKQSWSTVAAMAKNLMGKNMFKKTGDSIPLSLLYDKVAVITGTVSYVTSAADNSIGMKWKLLADRTVNDARGLAVVAGFATECWAGGKVIADGREIVLNKEIAKQKPCLLSGNVKELRFSMADDKKWFEVKFDKPQSVIFQDDRAFSASLKRYTLRIYMTGGKIEANRNYEVACRFSGKSIGGGLGIADDKIVKPEAGKGWTPIAHIPDVMPGSALDFSDSIPARHRPAGKFGRVVVRNGHFEFADLPGVEQRLSGPNVCGASVIVDADTAAKLVKRISALGCNSVRVHNHDWAFTGKSKDGTSLDAENMSRFDAFYKACVDEGLYVTIDLFVNRKVPWRACGIDRDGEMSMGEYKNHALFHEGTYSNLLVHSRAFLTHVNPHTGNRYADDPALACISLMNEANAGNHGQQSVLNCKEASDAWEAWKNAHDDSKGSTWEAFLANREDMFRKRMTAFFRDEIKSAIPLTNMNGWHYTRENDEVRKRYDYADQHHYVAHPQYLQKPYVAPVKIDNDNPLVDNAWQIENRALPGMPFAVSEWNYCAPHPYRSLAGLAMGTMACEKDFGALWRYAWSDNPSAVYKPEAYPSHFFMIAGDPLAKATENVMSCLFLRRDGDGLPPESTINAARMNNRICVRGSRTAGGWMNRGRMDAGALAFSSDSPVALWASTCDGKTFGETSRVLVNHLTELANTGAVFSSESMEVVLATGNLPLLVKNGKALVWMSLPEGNWKLYALATDGRRKSELPLRLENSRYVFVADTSRDPGDATISYELVR